MPDEPMERVVAREFVLVDAEARLRARLAMVDDGSLPAFELFGEEQRALVGIVTDGIFIADAHGARRVKIVLAQHGTNRCASRRARKASCIDVRRRHPRHLLPRLDGETVPNAVQRASRGRGNSPFQALLIADADRLGREQIETSYMLKQFSQAGVRIHEVKDGGRELSLDSPVDKMLAAVLAGAAEIEREKAIRWCAVLGLGSGEGKFSTST